MNIHIVQRRVGQRVRLQNDEHVDEDDIDPDLRNEVEIQFTARDIQSSAKSRQTISRKSSRKSEAENSIPSSRIVKSRGRPIKPHETEPFLSIDNLPADRTLVSERSDASVGSSRPPTYRNSPGAKSPNQPQMSPYVTPRQQSETVQREPSKTPPIPDLRPSQSARSRSNVGSRSASRQGSRSGSRQGPRPGTRSQVSRASVNSPLMSPGKPMKTPNYHVKSPFKHAVFKPQMILEGRQTPSHQLKERTTQAAFYINRLMAMSTEKEPPRTAGRLKKGRLKPLYPVNIEGPSINRCRGIVSEARSYEASPSRTLQRRIHLMNTIPNVHEYLMEHRPCTTESVHQTSVASSDGEVANMKDVNNDETIDSNRSIPDKDPYFEIDENMDATSLTSPIATNDDINNIKGPDPESRGSSVTDSPTPRMFATELGTRSPQAVDGDLTIPPQLLQFHETQDQLSQSRVGETDVIGSGPVYDQDNTEPIPEQDNTEPAPEQDNNAQKVRSTSPSKSVRFAEKSAQSNKDIKQQTNIAKQQKARQGSGEDNKNKKKSKNSESCKSNDINEIHKKDDDDDNENKDNDKNRQTQSQSTPGSAVRDSAGTTKENKSGDTKSEGENKSSSQDQKRSSRNMRPRSHSPLQGQNCTKFRKSSASKPHKNKLQVQTVNHANATPTILGPESPSMSRSCSQSGNSTGKKGTEHDQYSFLAGTALDEYDYFRERSKVKFMIEGEEPEIETIFVEDENDIGLRPDKDITFEAIESELKSLRHRIQNKLFEQGSDKLELYDESDNDNEEAEDFTETDANNGEEMLFVEGRNPSRLEKESVIDTVQTDYTDLIEKYRKRCMDRSELYGAFSEKLITPRSQSSYANSNQLMHMQKLNTMNSDTSVDFDQKSKLLESSSVTHISDSGLGSLDNVSEVSKTASLKSGVPRLNLESCTSDLDLDSGSESSGQDKDDSDGTIVADKEFGADKNILEMVCDDLPPAEPKEDVNRKETPHEEVCRGIMPREKEERKAGKEREEDVSKLTVVATTKCLSKLPQEKLTISRSSSVPFPPLCFTINARPPTGYLYYFAYGPDMNPCRFSCYIKREIEERFWALLFGFNLVFNKKGTSIEAGGFANLEFNPLRSVEGCLYKITPKELEVLDKCVGYPEHYEHLVLPVWFSNSQDPEQYGVCQYCVPALTFIAQNNWTETETKLPCDYSLSQCIKSADLCTQEYRDSLMNMTRQIEAAA